MLRACNLKTFFLAQDAAIGDVTEESIFHNLSASRYYVFFLTSSVSDIDEKGTTFCKEWKHAWNGYAFSKVHDIVLINFDLLRFSTIKDRRMKATCIKGLGHVVNFSDAGFKSKIVLWTDQTLACLFMIWLPVKQFQTRNRPEQELARILAGFSSPAPNVD